MQLSRGGGGRQQRIYGKEYDMNRKRCSTGFFIRFGAIFLLTGFFFAACEQPPGQNQTEENEQETPPSQSLAERPAGGGTEATPGSVPAGFVFVPRGTVTGSDAYSVAFTYPPGATFEGETGTQYGAFV
jgi:hypothetical protein